MTFHEPFSTNEIDRLVRATLEADGQTVEVTRLVSAIAARQHAAERGGPTAKSTLRRAVRWGMAAAACLMIAGALSGYLFLSPTPASAYSLVQAARQALAETADRCYRVEMQVPNGWPFITFDDQTLVWTRGDRYRVTMVQNGKDVVWGQDEEGRFWVVYSADRGLLFERREMPKELSAVLSYLSLDVRKIAGQILEDCDLQLEPGGRRRDAKLATVSATVKKGRNVIQFQTAKLDIDVKANVIRNLELMRLVNGVEQGRVQFTLVDESPQTDDSYRLKPHLAADARILGRSRYSERLKLLMQLAKKRAPKDRAAKQSDERPSLPVQQDPST